jgi:predicted Zn finger-like uncharacterized protein
MIEIVCPLCQARYQLPEGSIGPEGRKVSCSSCSHKWRAHAEGMAPAEAASSDESQAPAEAAAAPEAQPSYEAESPAAEAQPSYEAPAPAAAPVDEVPAPKAADATPSSLGSIAETAGAEAAASIAAVASASVGSAGPGETPPPADGSRDEQMAAIRRMLSDLKEGADAEPEPEPEETREPVVPPPSMRVRPEDEDDGRDQLKSRIDELSKSGRTAKGQPEESGYDAAKLRRMHDKRAKRLQRSRERRKKSGAFITGFTLVSVVTVIMVGLYVLRPQIIAASPEMAPAMNEYVLTVDRYRVELNAATTEWREWLAARIADLKGEQPETGEQATTQ